MIVRSIRAADWRCFLNAVEVGPFADGLNVIHARNAAGKSTLFEALRRALLDGHRVTGKDVEALRPWGRELSPKVTVEFVHLGQEYRIAKQFIENQSATLERKENGKYQRLAEGTAADDRAREILTKNPPSRGLARVENWGIAQILWAPQGSLALGQLSGDVVSDIRSMLGAQVAGAGTGPIEQRIETLYLQFFTAKGKLKTGKEAPLLSRLQEQLAEAREARQRALESYTAFEDASRRVEECQARRAQARHDADEIARTLRDARGVLDTYQKLLTERDQRLERASAAEAQYKELKQRIDLIKSLEAESSEARKTVAALEGEAPLKDKEVLDREKESAKRKAELEDKRKARETVDAVDHVAKEARRFNECRRELQRLDDLTSKLERAETSLAECRQRRSAIVAPDARLLKAVRKTIKERDDAQVRIEASLITLEIVPLENVSVDVVAGEAPGAISIEAGVPAQIKGSPEVVADIAQVARLRAWGPAGSVEEYRKARADAERKLKDLTEPFGTSDPEALEALAEKTKELDANVAEADTRLRTLLAGRSLEDLLRERSILETARARFLEAYPAWDAAPPDAEALEAQAERVKREFVASVESLEDAWEKAQNALSAVAGQKETLSRRLEDTRKQVGVLAAKLADLMSDGKPAQDRDAELQRVTMAWDAARTRLAEIQTLLAEYEEDPAALVDRLSAQREAASAESDRVREMEVREEARLENLCAQGTYSALAAAEEKASQLEQQTKHEELRVDALRLLHDTMAACRADAIAAVSGPVEAMAARTLHRIAGRRLGRIQVGETLEPIAVVPDTSEQAVTLDDLSGGEQEQLYFATRLALAQVLGKDERQLLVLDDVFMATDAGRLARVLGVIEEAAQSLQVLILTCHPERYRGLKNAAFHDLERLVRDASGE